MAAEFSELMAALGQVRAALAERLHVDASWRALMQLEARAAAGQLLPGPDAARLRTSLDRELARNRVYQALRRVDDALAVLKAPDFPAAASALSSLAMSRRRQDGAEPALDMPAEPSAAPSVNVRQVASASASAPKPDFERPAEDLTKIRGIGRSQAAALNAIGVRHFATIAGWRAADVARVSDKLALGKDISRQNWIEQAALLDMQRTPAQPAVQSPPVDAAKTASAPQTVAFDTAPLEAPDPAPEAIGIATLERLFAEWPQAKPVVPRRAPCSLAARALSALAARLNSPAPAVAADVIPHTAPVEEATEPKQRPPLEPVSVVKRSVSPPLGEAAALPPAPVPQSAPSSLIEAPPAREPRLSAAVLPAIKVLEPVTVAAKSAPAAPSPPIPAISEEMAQPAAVQVIGETASEAEPPLTPPIADAAEAAQVVVVEPKRQIEPAAALTGTPIERVIEAAPIIVAREPELAPDQLELIAGVDGPTARRLASMGVKHFKTIAAWSAADVIAREVQLLEPRRIRRQGWIEQAAMLARGTHTRFAARRLEGWDRVLVPMPWPEPAPVLFVPPAPLPPPMSEPAPIEVVVSAPACNAVSVTAPAKLVAAVAPVEEPKPVSLVEPPDEPVIFFSNHLEEAPTAAEIQPAPAIEPGGAAALAAAAAAASVMTAALKASSLQSAAHHRRSLADSLVPLTPATPVHDLRKWSADTAEELCEPVAAETEPDGGEIGVGEAEVVIVARPPSTDPHSLSDLRSAAAAAAFKARQQAQAEEFDGESYAAYRGEVEEASVEIVRQYPAPSGNAETSHLPTATAPVAVKSQPVGIEEKAGLKRFFRAFSRD